MAYVNYHIQKYTDDSTTEDNISDAANCLTMPVQEFTRASFDAKEPLDRIFDTSKLVQDRFSGPIAQNKKYLSLTDFDEYTWEVDSEEMYSVGGYLMGDWTSAKLPYVDQSSDNAIADMFGASFLAAIVQEDFSQAYAYFRMGQSLMEMSVEEEFDVENVDANVRQLAVTLNSF